MKARHFSWIFLMGLFSLLLTSRGVLGEPAPTPPQETEKASENAQAPLVFGMTPVVGKEATAERFRALTEHMSLELGRPVSLVVTESYGDLIDRMTRGEIDLAKFSPLAYVRAKRQLPALQLIASHVAAGSVNYSSYLVAPAGNPHSNIKRLRGARICFADPNSTSGYLFPLNHLLGLGLIPKRDFASVDFAGDHRRCLEGLFAGRYDVAATWAGALRDARTAGLGVGELAIVAKTGRIPYDAYCLRPGLHPGLGQRVQTVLLELNTLTRKGRRVLSKTLSINGWVPGNDALYDGIRHVEAKVRQAIP